MTYCSVSVSTSLIILNHGGSLNLVGTYNEGAWVWMQDLMGDFRSDSLKLWGDFFFFWILQITGEFDFDK